MPPDCQVRSFSYNTLECHDAQTEYSDDASLRHGQTASCNGCTMRSSGQRKLRMGLNAGMIILCTYPDKETATSEAKRLVELRLAACASILSTNSIFIWEGETEDVPECMVLFKTAADTAEELRAGIEQNHPYDVPEIIRVKPHSVNGSYLDWLVHSTRKLHSQPAKKIVLD